MNRKRYMISWKRGDTVGRDGWVMERKGKLSASDIIRMEIELGTKWNLSGPVTITNFVQVN